jgi:hypothetical protein
VRRSASGSRSRSGTSRSRSTRSTSSSSRRSSSSSSGGSNRTKEQLYNQAKRLGIEVPLDDDEGAARAGDHPSAFAFVDRRGGPAWSMRAGPAWHLLTRRAGPTTDGQCKARTCDLLLVRSVRATALSAIERCLVPRRVAGHPRVVSNGQDFPTTNPTTARDAKSRGVTRAQV